MRYWILFALAIGCYMLTWIQNSGAAISFNAYDLAEWASLHPIVPSKPHPLTISLALRLPLVLLIWMMSFVIAQYPLKQRFISLIALAFLLVSTMPPPEIIINRTNPNYLQQALLFVIACIGVGMIQTGILNRIAPSALWVLAVGIVVASVWGVFSVQDLMIGFSMPVVVTMHAFLFCGLSLWIAYLGWKQRQGEASSPKLAVEVLPV
jgi:hypothetical protein